MTEKPLTKPIDAVYTDIITHVEDALAHMSDVGKGLLLDSLLVTLRKLRRRHSKAIEKNLPQ